MNVTLPVEVLAGIGAIIGGLAGALTYLLRALVGSKNETIRVVIEDRNYWRDIALRRATDNGG